MKITNEWLEEIQDENGLTRGQEFLLKKWVGDDLIGKELPDQVANFLMHCRGYREIPQYIIDFKGWT